MSPEMTSSLRSELLTHDGCHEIALCLYLTVVASCYMTGTEFCEEIWEESRVFLLDEILTSCILKGAVEAGGINEDGEFTYEITDFGRSQVAEGKEGRGRGCQQDSPQEPDQG